MEKDEETARLLRAAARKIRELRQEVRFLGAQVSVIETFRRAMLGEAPAQGQEIDIAWSLDNRADQFWEGDEK